MEDRLPPSQQGKLIMPPKKQKKTYLERLKNRKRKPPPEAQFSYKKGNIDLYKRYIKEVKEMRIEERTQENEK